MSNILNKKNFIKFLIFCSFLKILIAYFFGDHTYEMEWSVIVKNLKDSFIFSFHEINGQKIPTAYMPPLYAYILYVISLVGFSEFVTVKIILILQCFLSGLSILFFFKILEKYFNEKNAILFSLLYFLFPLNFYSSTQISSVSFQVSIFIFFLYYYLNLVKKLDHFKFGFLSGLAILIRGEFWLLFLILIIFRFINKKINFKNAIIVLIPLLIVISPTLTRNYIVFDQFVLTKSSGYNLWRGNSKSLNVNGENIDTLEIQNKKNKLKQELIRHNNLEKYEILLDQIYFDIAIKNISDSPEKYIVHYLNKFFAFSFINIFSNYPNYFHPIIFIPEIIISLFGILGILQNLFSRKKNYELLIIVFYYLFLIPIFFVLPRYKLFILPIYFIFSCYFFDFLSKRIFSNKQ